MSIIEKALDKQRGSQQPGDDGTRLSQWPNRREQIASPLESSRPRTFPRESIDVSIDSLRAAGVMPPEDATDRFREQFRRIKWPVLGSVTERIGPHGGVPANLIMLTSSVAGEGKTFVSFNLAESIAHEQDFSVLLVDADVAKRHLTRVLKTEERPGLTDALTNANLDAEDFILGTCTPGLLFLPAGRSITMAPELFASQRMADIITGLSGADRHRVILFDSSPLLATNESQLLAKLVDQVVLVVRAAATPQPVVLEAIGLLDRSKQIRCVLNQLGTGGPAEYYYGYGYPSNDRPNK